MGTNSLRILLSDTDSADGSGMCRAGLAGLADDARADDDDQGCDHSGGDLNSGGNDTCCDNSGGNGNYFDNSGGNGNYLDNSGEKDHGCDHSGGYGNGCDDSGGTTAAGITAAATTAVVFAAAATTAAGTAAAATTVTGTAAAATTVAGTAAAATTGGFNSGVPLQFRCKLRGFASSCSRKRHTQGIAGDASPHGVCDSGQCTDGDLFRVRMASWPRSGLFNMRPQRAS